jgi:ABC-type Mn2+/Zn2+ transport system ATPase subunit
MNSSISVKNLNVWYGKQHALADVSFELGQGTLVGIIGPNGSGKSTLLKAILELIPSQMDEVSFYSMPLDQAKSKIAYVPQRESVDWNFPISVEEVVSMGRLNPKKLFQRTSAKDKQLITETLRQVGIEELRKKQIGELSGGQQQRVFIARAIAQQADLILMDEPFVGIDMASQENILELLLKLKNDGKTVVMVHHDLSTVAQYFDEVLLMNNRLVVHDETKKVLQPELLHSVYGKLFNETQL